jgi:hypothetical protein
MMYDTLQGPPEHGSIQEMVCVQVFQKRQRARYIEALIPLAVNAEQDSKKKMLDEYFAELFPHAKADLLKKDRHISEILQREMEKGPLAVQPIKM